MSVSSLLFLQSGTSDIEELGMDPQSCTGYLVDSVPGGTGAVGAIYDKIEEFIQQAEQYFSGCANCIQRNHLGWGCALCIYKSHCEMHNEALVSAMGVPTMKLLLEQTLELTGWTTSPIKSLEESQSQDEYSDSLSQKSELSSLSPIGSLSLNVTSEIDTNNCNITPASGETTIEEILTNILPIVEPIQPDSDTVIITDDYWFSEFKSKPDNP